MTRSIGFGVTKCFYRSIITYSDILLLENVLRTNENTFVLNLNAISISKYLLTIPENGITVSSV